MINTDTPPQPLPDPDSAGFWASTGRGELALRRCQACRRWVHPPLASCSRCGNATDYECVSGGGTIHSFIVVHQPAVPGYQHEIPYVVGLIDLDDQPGLRLSGRILSDPATVGIGRRVAVGYAELPGGEFRIPVFTLDSGPAD